MSEALELQRAKHEFRQFIRRPSASQARNTGPGETDSEAPRTVDIPRADALNCFLRKRPHFERFRAELAKVRAQQQTFTFVAELWEKENEE